MGKKTFSSFKPKNFQPSATDRFYVEFKELGSKISSLKSKLIFLGDDKKLLVKSIDTDDGNIVTGEVQLTPYFKIEYPVSWEKPNNVSISFIDDQNGKIYNFFHSLPNLTELNKFKGISPLQLHNYSISIRVPRYNKIGEDKFVSEYTLFPKSLPKWVNDYDGSGNQVFEIEFIIVDYKLEFL
jgi:hypothetical protein